MSTPDLSLYKHRCKDQFLGTEEGLKAFLSQNKPENLYFFALKIKIFRVFFAAFSSKQR